MSVPLSVSQNCSEVRHDSTQHNQFLISEGLKKFLIKKKKKKLHTVKLKYQQFTFGTLTISVTGEQV